MKKLLITVFLGSMVATNSGTLCGMNIKSISTKTNKPLSGVKNRYTCLVCNVVFNRAYLCNNHICKPGTRTASPQCSYCGESSFKNKGSLSHHESYCKKNPQRTVFTCLICDKICSTKSNLSRHISDTHFPTQNLTRKILLEFGYSVATQVMPPTPPKPIDEQLFQSFFK